MNDLLYEAQLLIDKAEDALDDAEYLIKSSRIFGAANRTYYGIFNCLAALLITENVVPKTHKGAHIKFRELFVKTDKLPKEMSDWAKRAEELRQSADYDLTSEIGEDEVKEALRDAYEFYNLTKAYIGKIIADSAQ